MTKPKLKLDWKQTNNKVHFNYRGTEIYFILPDDFKLSNTHPDLLKLSEHFMFNPWYDVIGGYTFTRSHGDNYGLSFSTGVDSTANMILLPEAHLVYTERDGIQTGLLNQDNAFRMINNMDRNVIRVKTNFELIRTFHGLQAGYSTGLGMGVPLILLSDYLNLGVISYGKVLEDQYFPMGLFRDYSGDYYKRQDLFDSCGLTGLYPTVGCTEVITTKIVDNSKYGQYSMSCVRGSNGKGCNRCFKCFRKNILRGREYFLDPETKMSISKKPPKMAPSLMYGLKSRQLKLPEVSSLWNRDVSMLDKVYYPAYDLYSEGLRTMVLDRLEQQGIQIMNEDEVNKLKTLTFI